MLAGIVAIGAVAAPSAPAVAEDDNPLATTVEALVSLLDSTGVTRYWTADRMASATPLDLGPDGTAASASGGTARAAAAQEVAAPRSVGKLFFSDATSDYVCSAATVNTAGKNVVITAGHCANTGGTSGGLLGGGLLGGGLLGGGSCKPGTTFSNFLFVPRYDEGAAPDGKWVGTRAIIHREWVERCDAFAYDQALIEMAPRNGRQLVDVVGGNGLAIGFPGRQNDVRIWGWPAQAPFDGETSQRCAGPTVADGGDARMECDLTGGASGGPWFISMASRNVGYIWAVTSRRTLVGTPYILAAPLSSNIRSLVAASGESRPLARRTAGGTSGGAVSSSRRGLALRATPGNVGRGQSLTLRVRAAASRRVVLEVRRAPRGAWRTVRTLRTNASGVAEVRLRPQRIGALVFRARVPGRAVQVPVRILSCPVPLDRSAADNTACGAPTA